MPRAHMANTPEKMTGRRPQPQKPDLFTHLTFARYLIRIFIHKDLNYNLKTLVLGKLDIEHVEHPVLDQNFEVKYMVMFAIPGLQPLKSS